MAKLPENKQCADCGVAGLYLYWIRVGLVLDSCWIRACIFACIGAVSILVSVVRLVYFSYWIRIRWISFWIGVGFVSSLYCIRIVFVLY